MTAKTTAVLKRTEHIQIRVTPREKRQIEKAAAKSGLSVAGYLRHLALTERRAGE